MVVVERSEKKPLYEEVVHKQVSAVTGVIILAVCVARFFYVLVSKIQKHLPNIGLDVLIVGLLMFLSCLFVLSYLRAYPLLITVDDRVLTLQTGRFWPENSKKISLSSISAIRRSLYKPLEYEKFNQLVDYFTEVEVWKMGGKEVLEIDVQDSRRIIILSSRADQLASLLHEMTRVPVEDCR